LANKRGKKNTLSLRRKKMENEIREKEKEKRKTD